MVFHMSPSFPFSSSPPLQDRRKLAFWLTIQSHVHQDTLVILNGARVVNLADDSLAEELVDLPADELIPKSFMTLADVYTSQNGNLLQSPKPTGIQWKSKQCTTYN